MGMFYQAARIAMATEPGFVLVRLDPLTGLVLTFRSWFPTKGLPLPGGPNVTESVVANELIEMGRMTEARENLLRLVRLRFPAALTPDVQKAIADQPNFSLMKTWLAAAYDSATADDFLAVLRR